MDYLRTSSIKLGINNKKYTSKQQQKKMSSVKQKQYSLNFIFIHFCVLFMDPDIENRAMINYQVLNPAHTHGKIPDPNLNPKR